MKIIGKVLVCAAVGAGFMALAAVNASAEIVCSGKVCWHAHDRYNYPRSAHVVVHTDDWHWGPGISIREHEGRGYWRGERWHGW
jgi:hypothetical protein